MSSESGRSVRSATSARSNVSQKSGVSNSGSWFSIGSLSNFQASRIIDSKAINRPPRVRNISNYSGFVIEHEKHNAPWCARLELFRTNIAGSLFVLPWQKSGPIFGKLFLVLYFDCFVFRCVNQTICQQQR